MLKKLMILILFFTLSLYATTPERESVVKLYIATFDRAPDADGLEYWLNDSKLTLEEIAQSFFDQKETKALYPEDYSNERFIEAVYRNLFNRSGDKAGVAYWLTELDSGSISRDIFILAVINGALGDDAVILDNKTIVGLAFANAGMNDIDDARDIMSGITADPYSVAEALFKYGLGPDPSEPSDRPYSPTPEPKPSNWYIRLIAENPARGMKTESTQLGELEGDDVVSRYTLKALDPFGGSYIDIIFVNPDGVAAGNYKVNFHSYSPRSEDRWRFTVKTDDSSATILLTWRGIYLLSPYVDQQNRTRYSEYQSTTNPLIKQMKLVDSSNGVEIPALVNGKVQIYTFNMSGQKERDFEWVVQTTQVTVSETVSRLSTLQARALQKDAKIMKSKSAGLFDLSRPPMIEQDYSNEK
ncbi:MAG: DUF4214 domain-containing protein [Campylobacterota bacterium]|nr:DUF4214 domain-containing protein [Campylobacterota bacterium]